MILLWSLVDGWTDEICNFLEHSLSLIVQTLKIVRRLSSNIYNRVLQRIVAIICDFQSRGFLKFRVYLPNRRKRMGHGIYVQATWWEVATYMFMYRLRQKGRTSVPKQDTAETQETSNIIFTAADYRAWEAVSTTEVSGIRRTIGAS